ncbi:three-Cys-motif partner protein TcmP [Chitinophaga sp. S165]|uniref:three-Cys-motif partner protein TcmP n=1 Tax=Chitinophaga sp. S165 TaxID=2135462 RepID=UPI000D70E798|nr:three-Cys-motif partner protein TcmP [Chitinophaga sp. S165]PWV56610.1 three-Cys-motif partner protein [Chitinophaga sp. S165]
MTNQFGGSWTDQKMAIVVAYAKAYLTIMKEQRWAKTIYFDGFAGSGSIKDNSSLRNNNCLLDSNAEMSTAEDIKKGTALRILDISEPKPFDLYYFVEKNESYQQQLLHQIGRRYVDRKCHVVKGDCNKKLNDLAGFLKQNNEFRALCFIDPYGMSVKWSSIEALRGLGVDLWILVPTGVSANRVLVNDGNIPDVWLNSLEIFLGLKRDDIKRKFYKEVIQHNLFGDDLTLVEKERDTVNKLGKLYAERLQTVFNFVSESFVLRNSMNSIMYHFMMGTNNPVALKIANDVIKPKYKL